MVPEEVHVVRKRIAKAGPWVALVICLALGLLVATGMLKIGDSVAGASAGTGSDGRPDLSNYVWYGEDEETPAAAVTGVAATGPVPDMIAVQAAKGDVQAQISKYVWESGGRVIPGKNGEWIIPMPDRIPDGIDYPRTDYANFGNVSKEQAEEMYTLQYLDPEERGLFQELMVHGKSFATVKGADGYLHIIDVVWAD